MCGVLGIFIRNFNKKDYDLIRSLFIQSMIRGKHATGVSYVKHDRVNTIKDPLPAKEWIESQNIEEWVNEDGNLYCIGHVRYSTSDLRYNQPMSTDELAIVHNGVISQEPFSTWYQKYSLQTETENDSELILRAMEKREEPLTKFQPSSMAVCTINKNKMLSSFRNGERPLYYTQTEDRIIFASTKDILKRSGVKNDISKTEMYKIYNVDCFRFSSYNISTNNVEDLQ